MSTSKPQVVRCACGRDVPFEDEDRGTDVFCWSCGRACPVPADVVVAPDTGGRIRWVYPRRGDPGPGRPPLRNGPVVDPEGRLIAGLAGELVALEPDGSVAWSYPLGGHVPGSPVLGADGVVRAHASDGLFHGIRPDGRPAWAPVDVGAPLGSASPLVDDAGDAWICPASGGIVRVGPGGAFDADRPFVRSTDRFDATGLIRDGVLYVGAEFDACVRAIRLGGGRGEDLWDRDGDRGRTGWSAVGAIALGDGPTLVVPCRDEHLYGFRTDGRPAWSARMPGQLRAAPVVDERGYVFLGVSRPTPDGVGLGALVGFDPASKAVRVRYEAGGPVESTPVLGDDGVIYFGDNAGLVHAVDPFGRGLWAQDVGAPVRSAGTIAGPGLVVFGRDDGRLVALEIPSRGLAGRGWPKFLGDLAQSGRAPGGGA